jgi:hypothetical protein
MADMAGPISPEIGIWNMREMRAILGLVSGFASS